MLKLVMSEFRYHRVGIGAAYSLILLLAVCHLLFEGATWQVISTTSSTILIVLLIFLVASVRKEKRNMNTLPLPVTLRTVGMVRLLVPISAVTAGLAVPLLFFLLFAPGRITLLMAGSTLRLLGFLLTVGAVYTFLADLRHVFHDKYWRLKYISRFVLLKLILVVMFASVYLLPYAHFRKITNLDSLGQFSSSFPGALAFGIAFILTGTAILIADVPVYERRRTYLE
jgi:hypothetical protein